jgi:hypothetical protein
LPTFPGGLQGADPEAIMRHLLIVLAFLGLPSFAAEEKPLPPAAKVVMEKLQKNADKLSGEYKKSLNAERAKTITELQKVQKEVTRSGDLDAALLVKKQIEAIQAQIDADEDTDLLGNRKTPDYAKLMTGNWTFQKTNGASGTFEAFPDGRISGSLTAPIPWPFLPGKWEMKGDQLLLTWANDPVKVETLTFTAPNRLAGDSFDAGKNSFNATKVPPPEK